METDGSPPTKFVDHSPEMVYDNQFSDSDDDDDTDLVTSHEEEVLSTPGLFDKNKKLSDDNVTSSNQHRSLSQEEHLETDNYGDTATSQLQKEISEGPFTLDDIAEGKAMSQYHTKASDLENFEAGWTLNEEDLVCLPLVVNEDRLAERKVQGANSPTVSHADKGNRSNVFRLFKRRQGKGSTRLVFVSPFSMIADIAKQYGYDLPTLLETSEFMGPTYQLPCMQCYEKYGKKGESELSSMVGMTSEEDGSTNGRCSGCGGQVHTLATYGKMIRQLREKIERQDLIPYDVYPDGNCLFASIVDQLHIHGDFSFTPHSLRQLAVDYLRKNPTIEDGTPLAQFLENESWESYLTRMSEDGEWGDHIILDALANVIRKRIVIYGGMTGQNETCLSPKCLDQQDLESDPQHDLVKDYNVIYLGHVGESHYMSLRSKGWRRTLLEDLEKRRCNLPYPYTPEDHCEMKCPVQHINLILRLIFRMDFIKSSCSDIIDMLVPTRHEIQDCVHELFGSVICEMVPSKVKLESFGPDLSLFFPSVKEENANVCFQTPSIVCFRTPKDTNIMADMDQASSTDLISENDAEVVGRVVLIPKTSKIWKDQVMSLNETKVCLKTFDIDDCMYGQFPSSSKVLVDFYSALGFKCAWPDIANEWPHRFRGSGFPDQRTVDTIVKLGCHVIPLLPTEKMSDIFDDPLSDIESLDDHSWCYSFVAAEKEICRFLSSEQRQSFLVFKTLVDSSLQDIRLPPAVVKSIFFYACEKIDKPSWKSKPGKCYLILLKKMCECFRYGIVPHYFMREKNLVSVFPDDVLAECYSRLNSARLQPILSLYFLLDQLNVMSSEVGSFVEEIIGNIHIDGQTNADMGPSDKALLPACSQLLQNLIYQEDYHQAMLVFQDVIEDGGGTLNTDGFVVGKKLLWNLHIGYQWCFALYVDIKQKTSLTTQLCKEGYEVVHVTEVFGPTCTEEIPDTWVPACFSIPSGDLLFLKKAAFILSQTISSKIYIECIKFYLKQYADLAGESLIFPEYNCKYVYLTKGKTKPAALLCNGEGNSLMDLQDIYAAFFNVCFQSYKTEEFRDLMPVYTKIAKRVGSRQCLKNLQNMWLGLGENQKAAEMRSISAYDYKDEF